jgi:formylmethanofuran dehydrogenase subunit C
VYVEGNVDSRMGISMTRGNIYIKGKIKEPIGNLIEVKSDKKVIESSDQSLTSSPMELVGVSLKEHSLLVTNSV